MCYVCTGGESSVRVNNMEHHGGMAPLIEMMQQLNRIQYVRKSLAEQFIPRSSNREKLMTIRNWKENNLVWGRAPHIPWSQKCSLAKI